MQSIDNKVISRIYGNQRGWSFSKNVFLDLGSDAAIRKALSRLEKKGTVE
jgi:ribosomal protein S19E (S16A)